MSNLFRKKSMDRISSPEQLNAYIRVSTPSVWIILSAVIVLLVGVCVWGVFGHMDTTLPALAVAQDGVVTAFIKEKDISSVGKDAMADVGGEAARVVSIAPQPAPVNESFTDYMRYVGGLQEGEWVYAVKLDASCPDGVYTAKIVIDSVSPMSFVLN